MKLDFKGLYREKGFTLLELLVVIAIIGFIASAATVGYNIVRIQARDALRVGNMQTISKALSMYQNDYGVYPLPAGTGECLNDASGAGATLKNAKVIVNIPIDPLWPSTLPSSIVAGHANVGSTNFCYYYSADGRNFNISYFLEGTTKSGTAGIHVMGPAGSN